MENLALINRNYLLNKNEWDKINEIRWYFLSKEYGYEANEYVGDFLKSSYTMNEIEKLLNFVVEKREELKKRLLSYLKSLKDEDKKRYYLGDDSTWDLCSHIVGLGEVAYNYVMNHIDIIMEMQKDFQENFEYGFDKAIYELNSK